MTLICPRRNGAQQRGRQTCRESQTPGAAPQEASAGPPHRGPGAALPSALSQPASLARRLGSHASVHVWTAGGPGNGLPERHASEPPRLVSSENAAVPRVILTFVSVRVIFINRLTHRPSPYISVNWGPECLLSTFPCGSLRGPQRQAADLPPIPREANRGQGAHSRLVS